MSYADDFNSLGMPQAKPKAPAKSNYDAMYAQAGNKYGVDPGLIKAVATTESSENPKAISRDASGKPIAHGLMQFIPSTAKAMGITDPYDVGQSIDAGARLLKQNLDASNGDTTNALKMYHGGTNTKNWGPLTHAYPNTVMSHMAAGQAQPPQATSRHADEFLKLGDANQPAAPAPQRPLIQQQPTAKPSILDSASAGNGVGVTGVYLGAKELLGKGLSYFGDGKYGSEMQANAQKDNQLLNQGNEEYVKAHPIANLAGQVTGGAAATAPLAIAGAPVEGANLVNQLIHASVIGAGIGALQPTADDKSSFWKQKAMQVGAGAAGGAIGQPVGMAAGYVGGKAINGVVNAARGVKNAVTNIAMPDIIKNSSPELQAAIMADLKAGKKINPDVLQAHAQADALPVPVKLMPGQASGDPIQISMEKNLRGRNPELAYRMADQHQALGDSLGMFGKDFAPDVKNTSNFANGQDLMDSISKKIDFKKQQTQEAYKNLADANGGNLPIDGQTFAINANKNLTSDAGGSFLPEKIQDIINKYQNGVHQMTFKDFDGLGRVLSAASRTAERAGDGNAVHAIGLVRDPLENMALPANAQHLKPLLDAARQSAKEGFDLERGLPVYKAVANDKASPDKFVQTHIISAKHSDVIGMANLLHDDPQALQTIKHGVITHLKDKAVGNNNAFSQANFNDELKALGPKLHTLFSPDEIQHLTNLGDTAKRVSLQPPGSFVNNSNTNTSDLAVRGGNLAGKAVDMFTNSPIGSIVNNAVQSGVAKKASMAQLRNTLKIGAGSSTNNPINDFFSNQFPRLVGKAASIPLAGFLPNAAANTFKAGINNRSDKNN